MLPYGISFIRVRLREFRGAGPQICILGAGSLKSPDHGDYSPPILSSASSPLPPLTNIKINDWWNCYALFHPTTNHHTPPWKAAHHSQWWATSTPRTPGTHCSALRYGVGWPGRGSPSSSATRSAYSEILLPSLALPTSLPDLCHVPGIWFCPCSSGRTGMENERQFSVRIFCVS